MLDSANFKLLSFDCYGTLIDWETGILDALRPVLAAHQRDLSDAEILRRYARIESTLQRGPYQSYRAILRDVTRGFGQELHFQPSEAELNRLPNSLAEWKPFPDTVEALRSLRKRFRLAILSNIDDDLFSATARQLAVPFDLVITAQQLGIYKPCAANFQALIHRAGVARSQILHVAESIYHDVIPARQLGLATVWVNRGNRATISLTGQPEPAARPALEVANLRGLAQALGC